MTLTVAIGNGSWYPANALPSNSIVVNNTLASTRTNYPLQIGRAFRQGEIPSGQSPAFSDNGAILTTQADVKNRWPDGSVKFAIMSAVIPSIAATTRKTINIVSSAPPAGSGLTVSQFLSDNPDFDVTLTFSSGVTATVSARTMMAAGAATAWCSGPVMTSWIVVDHITKAFDVGSDANKSIRPIFHVQKWAGQNTYRVRFITEISDITKLQLQTYALQVTSGIASPSQLLQTSSFQHLCGSKFSREYWFGSNSPSSVVGINHSISYLSSTRAIPNYDPSITLSNQTITTFLSDWAACDKGPFGGGLYRKVMPLVGGGADIGIFPSWHVWTLYSDNPDLQSSVRSLTDLAGSWMMNWRIGSDRTFDSVTGENGNGKFANRDSNPTQFTNAGNGYINTYFVLDSDKFTFLNNSRDPLVDNGWIHDNAHCPDPWYLTYLMSGDFWYLEQLQFWAAALIFYCNPGFGRSPSDAIIYDTQVRARAWDLRTRARAAWASPDGSAERAYLVRITEQALEEMKGEMIGPGGTSPIRAWWATNRPAYDYSNGPRPSPNALGFLSNGYNGTGFNDGVPKIVGSTRNFWMDAMFMQAFAHAAELGFNTQELITYNAPSFIKMATTVGVNPQHLADYKTPCQDTSLAFFQTWTDAFNGFDNAVWEQYYNIWVRDLGDLQHGYSIFLTCAMSFLKNELGGEAAWNWVNTNGYQVANWSLNPKMAIIPR